MTVKWQLPTAPIISSYPAGAFEKKARVGLLGVDNGRAKSRLRETAVADPTTGATILYQAQPTVLNLTEPKPFYPSVEAIRSQAPAPLPVVAPPVHSTPQLAVEHVSDTILNPTITETISSASVAQAAMVKAIAKRRLENPQLFAQTKKTPIWKAALRNTLLGIMFAASILMATIVLPEVYYRAFPEKVSDVASVPPTQLAELTQPTEPEVVVAHDPEPAFDASLPAGTWIVIPSIGVNTQLLDTMDPNEALNQGAWLVPDFGRPNDSSLPIIAAAHRFGWDWWWQSDFGRKNSFYSLPELKSGDTVEIVFNQRKYVYRVYSDVIEGTEITDYKADLILYTCKFLNSPERFFVYANRDTTAEISGVGQSASATTSLVEGGVEKPE